MFLVRPPFSIPSISTHAMNRVLDRPGLLTTSHENLRPGVENFVRDADEVKGYAREEERIGLLEVIKQAKPTILIGCSTMTGAFDEQGSPWSSLMERY